MAKDVERRTCRRFEVEGATLRYRRQGWFKSEDYTAVECPIENLSKGGVMFVNNAGVLNLEDKVAVRLNVSGGEELELLGRVKWALSTSGSLGAQVGVQFSTFGSGKGLNSPKLLEKLAELEQKYSS